MTPAATLVGLASLGAVLLAPGMAITRWARLAPHPAAVPGYALGLSVAVWPLLLLWTRPLGAVWGPLMVWAVIGVSLAAWVLARTAPLSVGDGAEEHGRIVVAALGALFAVALVTRVAQARGLAVPPWVDGLHHTEVTQLFLDARTLPATMRPYMPVDSFSYHFGFHAVAAAVAWAGHLPAETAVLWTGQALSAGACLTVFVLALALGTGPLGALAAAAVPATLYWFPMYYLTWSRFTQLAGLVLLPVATALLVATARRRDRRLLVAATVAAGAMPLAHYRVAVFFGLAALVLAAGLVGAAVAGRGSWRALTGPALVAGGAIVLAAPWLAGPLYGAAAHLRAATAELPVDAAGHAPRWYAAPEGVGTVEAWVFTQRTNALWLAVGALGLLVGLARRQAGALAVVAAAALAALAAQPDAAGLTATWMLPPFAVAISLWLPAALGVGYLTAGFGAAARDDGIAESRIAAGTVAVVLALTTVAALRHDGAGVRGWGIVPVVNPTTVIATPADVAAARWVAAHTPADATFLISADDWHLGTYRGLDGGYWLPLLAHRAVSLPGALYPFGDPAEVRHIAGLAARAKAGDKLTVADLDKLLTDTGARYVYTGPSGGDLAGKLTAARLRKQPGLRVVYDEQGVTVFERTSAREP